MNKTIEEYIVNQLNSIETLRSELNDLQIDYRLAIEDYEALKKEILKLFKLDRFPTSEYEENKIKGCKLEYHDSCFSPYNGVYSIDKNDTPTIFRLLVSHWQTIKNNIEEDDPEEDESEVIDHE